MDLGVRAINVDDEVRRGTSIRENRISAAKTKSWFA